MEDVRNVYKVLAKNPEGRILIGRIILRHVSGNYCAWGGGEGKLEANSEGVSIAAIKKFPLKLNRTHCTARKHAASRYISNRQF